jgi:hypothetical protein
VFFLVSACKNIGLEFHLFLSQDFFWWCASDMHGRKPNTGYDGDVKMDGRSRSSQKKGHVFASAVILASASLSNKTLVQLRPL